MPSAITLSSTAITVSDLYSSSGAIAEEGSDGNKYDSGVVTTSNLHAHISIAIALDRDNHCNVGV